MKMGIKQVQAAIYGLDKNAREKLLKTETMKNEDCKLAS
jgi:hypothetical protein